MTSFFEILPRLRPGVIVHFRDIWYPFEYPQDWLLKGMFWNEAYLVSVAAFSGIVFVCWARYTNYLASLAELPYAELRVGRSRDLAAFLFGDWHFRLNPFNWVRGGLVGSQLHHGQLRIDNFTGHRDAVER